MRYVLISLLMLLSLTGCENKETQAQHDAQVAQQAREALLAELEAKKTKEKTQTAPLNQMGINVENGTITIDTNKTKDFFHALGKNMDVQMKKMAADMDKGFIENQNAGIQVNEDHIHIDLNKTRDLLLEWSGQIQVFVEEFDKMSKTLEINSTNTTNKGI